MALSEKHRSSIYQGLLQFLGEEEAQALLSQFPARDLDVPVTKEFVRAEIADVRSQLRVEIADVRAELHTGLAGVRTEIADLRSEMHQGFGSIRAEMSERLREQTMWMAGSLVTGIGVAVGLASALG